MAVSSLEKNRYYILDLMRLVAALAVVFYHYSIYLDKSADALLISISDFGYLGVNFFFMLSGFVIMASAQNRTAWVFLFARAQRLYPAFIACFGIMLLAIWFNLGQVLPLKQILLNATLFNDYLKIPNIDGVYWTLQAEIKFYACIFMLLALRCLDYWRIWVPVWLLIAVIYHFFHQPFFMGWFINPDYSFYFIGGVAAYLMTRTPNHLLLYLVFFTSMFFAVIKAGSQVDNFLPHAVEQAHLVAQVIVGAMFLFFYALSRGYMRIASVPWWWVYLGAMSYPLYLLHNRAGKSVMDAMAGVCNNHLLMALVIVCLLVLSLLVHLLVERPINQGIAALKRAR